VEPRELARAIIEESVYMTLATADESGRPWASPVWFAPASWSEFVWLSRPQARHSQNIAARREVAIVFFDSGVAPGSGRAVYVEATAALVGEDEHAGALRAYNAREEAQGISLLTEDEVSGEGQLRLYRAVASQHYVLNGNDQREPVELE
jgi:pyridoxine/pyridoxamine 5'-phosphate oxidase